MSSTLTAATLRNLGQKEYDKRKQAALEVENLARELRDASEFEKVAGLIQTLSTDLAESPLANLRKGALHALAGTAIGLGPANVTAVLPALLSPVLACFQDQDPRVRYYGCEALYNIAKVARGDSVAHFNAIFDGLFKLSADTDISVQNGMQLVDRLMKDIVAESENFDVDGFMPLLRERVYVTNPFSRQFLVGWISALDSVPDMEMLTHLPVFFDGLFHMLADPNKEIRQQTYSVLSEFLREIREVETIKYAPAVQVLVQHSGSQDKFTRLTAITWLHAFVQQGRDQLLPFCAQVLNAVLASLSHAEDEIREAAQKADAALRQLLQESADSSYEVHTLLHALGGHLGSQYVPTLLASLQWVHMLLKKSAPRVMQLSQQIWPALFACLSNPSEEVVRLDIEALARMAPNEQQFVPFIDHLLHLFRRERGLLEKRGALVVRQLCELLHPRRVFVTLSRALQSEGDLEFASQMVQTLNLILLATNECLELREMLKQASTDADGCALFQTLYPAWSHNPVSLLSICLLSKSHEHAAQLVMEFGSLEVEVPFLMQVTGRHRRHRHRLHLHRLRHRLHLPALLPRPQIDKLVQLIESPIFTHVRLQLLEPERCPHLLKALWGLLMLLPQSPAFTTLKGRLAAVPEIGLLRLQLEGRKAERPPSGAPQIDFGQLLDAYRAVQQKHRAKDDGKRREARVGDGAEAGDAAPAAK